MRAGRGWAGGLFGVAIAAACVACGDDSASGAAGSGGGGQGASAGTGGGGGTGDDGWQPPIGIPYPSFGVDEVAPAFTHYVDATAANCADGTNAGTPAMPRCTIPGTESEPLAAGSVVEVHGRYDVAHTSPTDFHAVGTAAAPVFVRGASETDRPFFTRPFDVVGSSYLIVENIDFGDEDGDQTGGETGSFSVTDKNGERYDSDHIVLRSCDVSGNLEAGGTSIGGYSGSTTVSQVVFFANRIHDNGDVDATFDQDNHGTGVGDGAEHVWILDSEYFANSGDGVQINGTVDRTHHVYLGRNVSHGNKQTGLWSKTASDVIFSQNYAYGHRPSDSSNGEGLGYQYDPTRLWFLANLAVDNTCGICSGSNEQGTDQEVWLVGNIVADGADPGGAFDPDSVWEATGINIRNGKDRWLVANTVYATHGGISCYGGATDRCHLENNLVSSMLGGGRHVLVGEIGPSDMRNALVFQPGGPATFRWDGSSYSGLAALQGATGAGQASVEGDPLFVDEANLDLRLEAASPGKDAGLVSDAYATFSNLYGLDIAIDATGAPRPAGGGWDIGALE